MANTAIRGVPAHFDIDVDSWRWYEVVPKPECVACAVARAHGGAILCSIVCAKLVGFRGFTIARAHFAAFFMSTWMCTNHWIFVVLQWPARILCHFHAQSNARNALDFLSFTGARGHFAAFSCATECVATIRFSCFYNGPRSFCGISVFIA